MGKRPKQLSHAELWDDSALQRSWDDALSEYKLYHSIHARGERVEDVLREAEEKAMAETQNEDTMASVTDTNMQTNDNDIHADELEEGEVEEQMENPAPSSNIPVPSQPPQMDSNQIDSNQTNTTGESRDVPQIVSSNVKDEALKNLMMSWYYAGYYTGLYEGQQQSTNPAASSSTNGIKGGS